MKVVKTLLTLMLAVGVLGGAAYGVGQLVSDHRGAPGRVVDPAARVTDTATDHPDVLSELA